MSLSLFAKARAKKGKSRGSSFDADPLTWLRHSRSLTRVALSIARQYDSTGAEWLAVRAGLTWLLGDHLGSTSVTFGVDMGARSEQRYGANPSPGYNVQWPSTGNSSYGNNSTADYFANTFAATVTSYEAVPQPYGIWMAAYIDLTK